MRKFALATAAVAALVFSVPAFTAPALAQQGVTVRVNSGDRGHHNGWRHHDSRRVVIHSDRGRHEGWRHRNTGMNKTVIIKKHGNGSKTVIKKFD
jgi:hypothetical protein